jgi:outer membrane protein assembly factor BamB
MRSFAPVVLLLVPAQSPPDPWPVEAGLAVHVGTSDGAVELSLASNGRRLVHGLAADAASRDRARAALHAKAVYGLACVETWRGPALPYADRLVNLLVSSVAVDRAEVERVLAPGGVALLPGEKSWTQPRPKEIDDWTHFDHGPDGNGVSRDRAVRPPQHLQWISGVQEIALGGNPAGFAGLTGIRVSGGRTFFDVAAGEKNTRRSLLSCRDAWSGVPLWELPRDFEAGRKRWQLVASDGRVYTWLEREGRLVALEASTGKLLRTFDAAAAPPIPEEGTQLRAGREALVVNLADGLYALDPATGRLLWKRPAGGSLLLFPCLVEEAGRVYVAEAKAGQRLRSRWPSAILDAVLALDLRTGAELWRNREVEGKPVGQLAHRDGLLALFAGSAIGGRQQEGGWVSAIDVATGKLLGQGSFRSAYNDSMYNALVRDGAVWYAGHTSIYRFDPAGAGTITRATNLAYNQRCNRFTATEDLWLTGYVTYLDRDFRGSLQSAARAGCALGTTPANGMVYFTPSACRCFTQLRGYLALSPEPLRPPLDDALRLERGGPAAAPVPAGRPSGPLAADWTRQPRVTALETPPVPAGDLELVAVIHEHRVEARRGGTRAWSFTAGARVSGPPLVHEGRAFFGAHDGWVYALRLADGALEWRHLVAPHERKIVAYGQVESAWPVYGVVLHEGLVCAPAGHHPELGGGVRVSGLEPATGRAAWTRTLRKSAAALSTTDGKTTGTIVPRSFLNAPPEVEGGLLRIDEFVFDPKTPEAELVRRLDSPAPKKK